MEIGDNNKPSIKIFRFGDLFVLPFSVGFLIVVQGPLLYSFEIGVSMFVILATLCNIALRYASVIDDKDRKDKAILAGENLAL